MGILRRFMSHREFEEWCWVWDREPFDDQRRHDLPAAMQIAHTLNLNLKEDAEPFQPADFMPFRKRPEPPDEDIDAAIIGRL